MSQAPSQAFCRQVTLLGVFLLSCKAAPKPKPTLPSAEESIKQCLVLGGEFGTPGFSSCLVDRFGWASDSVVRMVEDSIRTLEIEMAKARAALRDSIVAQTKRMADDREAGERRTRLEEAEKQAILDSVEADRAARRLKAMAPKPNP